MKANRQRETIHKIVSYIKKYWWLILVSLLFAGITVVLTLYLPILTGDAVDAMVEEGRVDFGILKELLIGMAVMIAVTGIAQWLMNTANNKITYMVVRDIGRDAFHKIQKLPLKYLDGHSSGDVVSRIIADVDQFADGLLMGFTQAFTGILTIVGTLFHACDEYMDYFSSGSGHTIIIVCGSLYRKENAFYVSEAV